MERQPIVLRDKPLGHLDDPDGTILIPAASYLQAVRTVLGDIDIDPCSTARAQQHIDAIAWFRAEQAHAALAEPWAGRVFLHPHPNAQIARYQLQTLLRHYLAGRVDSAIILSPRIDWLRQEPILLSFPFLIHYKRGTFQQWNSAKQCYQTHKPTFIPLTHYLPARTGQHFDEEKLMLFHRTFSPIGRVILSEDLDGDHWEQDALVAMARFPVKPVLSGVRLERYSATPGALVDALFDEED